MNDLTVTAQPFDLSPRTLDEALKFADIVSKSGIVPKDFINNPGNVFVAIQWGMELGLKPMQAMQNIAVINGRPSLWGDAVIALVKSSPLCEYVYESFENDTAICRVKRSGEEEQVRTFGKEDASKAGLLNKHGPWSQYPKRMMQMRARAFALRDVFPDVLKGMPVAEEVMDYAQEKDITPPKTQAPSQQEPQKLPDYPQEVFDRNFQKWADAIREGKTTHEAWISALSNKGTLTEQQLQAIYSVQAPIEGEAA